MKTKLLFLLLIPLLNFAGVTENLKSYLLAQSGEIELSSQIHCGFHYELDLLEHYNELSPELQAMAKAARVMSDMQAEYISPAGHFKIQYDTSGSNAVDLTDVSGNGIPDFVDSAAAIFDHVWHIEIEMMGFQNPPNLGNDYYNIFINDQARYGYYGQTYIVNIDDPENIQSYIEIDKSFTSDKFYTKGLNALRVTAAHEFNHALQIGYNFHLSSDRFFMEMTSTWLEDFLYPDVNDYYAYLPVFFSSINSIRFDSAISFYPYANSIYLHMLTRKFSPQIVVDVWDKINKFSAMPALEEVISEKGASWDETQNEYAVWLYYTGDRAIAGLFFPDAARYPMITFPDKRNLDFTENFGFDVEVDKRGYKFYQIRGLQNIRYMAKVSSNSSKGIYTHVNAQNLPEASKRFNQQQAVNFDSQDSIVVVITNPDTSVDIYYTLNSDTTQPFLVGPNPVILDGSDNQEMNFYNVPPQGEIFIFSVNGKSLQKIVSDFPAKSTVSWDMRDYNNNLLSSGVYFYIVKSADFEKKGKFAVIRKQ